MSARNAGRLMNAKELVPSVAIMFGALSLAYIGMNAVHRLAYGNRGQEKRPGRFERSLLCRDLQVGNINMWGRKQRFSLQDTVQNQ